VRSMSKDWKLNNSKNVGNRKEHNQTRQWLHMTGGGEPSF
jgi:hypothetical protein